jgi:uncharacterized membrane protein YvlD (DUF360 family)
MLADLLVKGINMNGFMNSLLAAFIISILQHLLLASARSSD